MTPLISQSEVLFDVPPNSRRSSEGSRPPSSAGRLYSYGCCCTVSDSHRGGLKQCGRAGPGQTDWTGHTQVLERCDGLPQPPLPPPRGAALLIEELASLSFRTPGCSLFYLPCIRGTGREGQREGGSSFGQSEKQVLCGGTYTDPVVSAECRKRSRVLTGLDRGKTQRQERKNKINVPGIRTAYLNTPKRPLYRLSHL